MLIGRFSLDLVLSPFPEASARASISAVLDVRWCADGMPDEAILGPCESIIQLIKPTLAQDCFEQYIDDASLSSKVVAGEKVAARWDLPPLRHSALPGHQRACRVFAHVTAFDRGTGNTLTNVEVEVTSSRALNMERGQCTRPELAYHLLQAPIRRLWTSTSFFFQTRQERGSAEWPLLIYSHGSAAFEASSSTSLQAAARAVASKFVDSISPAGHQQSPEFVTAVYSGLFNARAAQDLSRRKLTRQVNEFKLACDTRVPGMRLVLGAGSDSWSEHSYHPPFSVDCDGWIVTDMSSLNWADWADWSEVFFQNNSTIPTVRVTHLLAEHVLEHLDLHDALSALSNAAQILIHAGAIEGQPSPFLRLAVPDIGFGTTGDESSASEMGHVASDIRDHHKARYTAFSLCALLDASGLDGYLLEWSHPLDSMDHIEKLFDTGTVVDRAVKIQRNSLQGSVSRIHEYDIEQGQIRRSFRG